MKTVLPPFQVFTSQAMSTSLTSTPTNIQYVDNVGIQVVVSASSSPVGTFDVEVSNDYSPGGYPHKTANAGTWVALGLDIPAVSGDTALYLDINQLSAPWIRLVYARTSGSATLDAFITAKAL